MHSHPWISSLSGVLANIAVLTTICLISWTRLFSSDRDLPARDDERATPGREQRNDKISDIETLTDNFGAPIPIDKLDSFSGGS